MNPTAFYATLGALVNSVLLRVLTEIEDQEDISEEESIRLNKLCKSLHELETLFVGDNGSVRLCTALPTLLTSSSRRSDVRCRSGSNSSSSLSCSRPRWYVRSDVRHSDTTHRRTSSSCSTTPTLSTLRRTRLSSSCGHSSRTRLCASRTSSTSSKDTRTCRSGTTTWRAGTSCNTRVWGSHDVSDSKSESDPPCAPWRLSSHSESGLE